MPSDAKRAGEQSQPEKNIQNKSQLVPYLLSPLHPHPRFRYFNPHFRWFRVCKATTLWRDWVPLNTPSIQITFLWAVNRFFRWRKKRINYDQFTTWGAEETPVIWRKPPSNQFFFSVTSPVSLGWPPGYKQLGITYNETKRRRRRRSPRRHILGF